MIPATRLATFKNAFPYFQQILCFSLISIKYGKKALLGIPLRLHHCDVIANLEDRLPQKCFPMEMKNGPYSNF